MLSLSHQQRIFLARAPVDMRKGFDGLAALVSERLGKDALSGDVFLFVSRRRNMVKVLMWDVSGFWLATKRLERGVFGVRGLLGSTDAAGALMLTVAEVMLLLEGVTVQRAVYSDHSRIPVGNNA